MFWKLAWRNLWRNRIRTLLSSFVIAFGLAALVFVDGLMEGMTVNMVRNATDSFLGHAQLLLELLGLRPRVRRLREHVRDLLHRLVRRGLLLLQLGALGPGVVAELVDGDEDGTATMVLSRDGVHGATDTLVLTWAW